MLLNFIKLTLRTFNKNKSYVLINILGLGISLGCCIIAYLNWKFASTHDHNHVNHERIYKIHSYKEVQGQKVPYGIVPMTLGKQLKGSISGITNSSRYSSDGIVIKQDLKIIEQNVGFADDAYFDMFTFPFKYGNKEALLDRSSIILTEELVDVYFDGENPVGEFVTIITDDGESISMKVGGVIEDIPKNSSMTFSAITHYDNFLRFNDFNDDDWKYFAAATFVMTNGDYPQNLLDFINENYIEVQNKARENFHISEYYLEQLTHLAKNSEKINANWLKDPVPSPAVIGPIVMAILMLLIACFNFTNTSIAISSKRLREIGIRKVMGSTRKQLIFQFMGENMLLSFLALLVGVFFADLLLPEYNALWGFIDLKLDLSSDLEIYAFLMGLLVLTSVVAGGYPSLYVSKYEPVKILRGSLQLNGGNLFTKVLLALQYAFTINAIISAFAFSANAKYQAEYDTGFDKNSTLSIYVDNISEYEKFRNEVAQMPEIASWAGTSNRIGSWVYGRTLKSQEVELEASMMDFTPEYFELMKLGLAEGRFFNRNLNNFDRENSIVLNERAVTEFGWKEPLGKVVRIDDSTQLTVVGVVEDFYENGFFNPVKAMGFRLADDEKLNYIVVKSDLDPLSLHKNLEKKWLDVIQNKPFDAEYDDTVTNAEEVNVNIKIMFQFLGFASLILSTIGLYTLVSLNILKRVKEIGVRKVLGASIQQILFLMNRQFFWLLIVAAIAGTLLSYFATDMLMSSIFFIYQGVGVMTVTVSFMILMGIALFISSARILATAIQNPVKSLRYE
ncbi:MAG: FtsX-like permease family protein [Bacteroidota bacterium]